MSRGGPFRPPPQSLLGLNQQKSRPVPVIPVRMEQLVLITMVAVVLSASVLLALKDQIVKMVHSEFIAQTFYFLLVEYLFPWKYCHSKTLWSFASDIACGLIFTDKQRYMTYLNYIPISSILKAFRPFIWCLCVPKLISNMLLFLTIQFTIYLSSLLYSIFCTFVKQKSWPVLVTLVRMEQLVLITMVAVVMSVSVLLALREPIVKMVLLSYLLDNIFFSSINITYIYRIFIIFSIHFNLPCS